MTENTQGSSNARLLVVALIGAIIVATVSLTALVVGGNGGGVNEDEVKRIVLKTIAEQPDQVVAAITEGQRRTQANERERQSKLAKTKRKDLENHPLSPAVGAENPKVTVVEFYDYRCGYCRKVSPTLEAVLAENDDVRVVYKEYPVLGQASVDAAKVSAAVTVVAKDKWLAFHKAMLQRSVSTTEQMLALAESQGIDSAKVKEAMEGDEVRKYIQETNELGSILGVRGTPAFFINGQLFPGAMSKEQFNANIKDARDRS